MLKAIVNNLNEINFEIKNEEIILNGEIANLDMVNINPRNFHIIKNGKSLTVEILSHNSSSKLTVFKINQHIYKVELKSKSDLLLKKLGLSNNSSDTTKEIKAPMPGLILEIMVTEGTNVNKGDPILILEAMKMENMIKSPIDGIIKSIKVEKGKSVEKNQILVLF